MDPITKELSEEHKHILTMVDALVRECEALEQGAELDRDFFKKAVDFIRHYADRFHHAKEEDILFEELGKPGVRMHCDPRQQMLHEHDLGRKYVKGMDEGTVSGDKLKVVENARRYSRLLLDHIYKEDNILYPMAEQTLGEETSRDIAARFRKVNAAFGGAQEKYLALARELAERRAKGAKEPEG
ncbi:MAG: hemerythrin domain-containing protein [Elusimicrobiota bacterium]